MDYDLMRRVWASNANTPDEAASAYLAAEAQAMLARRRAGLRRLMAFAGVMLTIPLALMGIDILTGQADSIDLTREWGLVPFALIPFVALILIAARAAPASAPADTLLETFEALRADNAAAIRRVVIISGATVVFAPLLYVLLNQLVATGKMAPHEMRSAALVLGGALVVSLSWMAVKFLTRLAPERRHLNALIAQYDEV
ncbi:MAG: hypothetical protein ABL308_07645 [Oceanicaulis sp.]